MAEIVQGNVAALKAAGFRKRRHSFNRRTKSGLVHVVKFWQAPKEPPAWTEVPGLRERLYGTFRVDFGVYVPEMTRTGAPRSDWVNEYNCHLRRTIGQLLNSPKDLWWPLSDPAADEWARAAIAEHGLPWLDSYADHEAVFTTFKQGGPVALGMAPAAPLDIAEMLTALDREADARSVLEAYVGQPALQSHAYYLAEYLNRIGHPDLVDRISTTSGS